MLVQCSDGSRLQTTRSWCSFTFGGSKQSLQTKAPSMRTSTQSEGRLCYVNHHYREKRAGHNDIKRLNGRHQTLWSNRTLLQSLLLLKCWHLVGSSRSKLGQKPVGSVENACRLLRSENSELGSGKHEVVLLEFSWRIKEIILIVTVFF